MRTARLHDIVDGFVPWLEDAMGDMTPYQLAKAIDVDMDGFAAKVYAWRRGEAVPSLASLAELCDTFDRGGAFLVPASTMRALTEAAHYAKEHGWNR